jgi:hypothetical protein
MPGREDWLPQRGGYLLQAGEQARVTFPTKPAIAAKRSPELYYDLAPKRRSCFTQSVSFKENATGIAQKRCFGRR